MPSFALCWNRRSELCFFFFFWVVVSWEIFGPIWCCCCELKMPIASIEAGDLNKVWEIRTLGKERDVEARKMLEMAAKQVQPIMRKRKWNVKLLSEFWYAQFFFSNFLTTPLSSPSHLPLSFPLHLNPQVIWFSRKTLGFMLSSAEKPCGFMVGALSVEHSLFANQNLGTLQFNEREIRIWVLSSSTKGQ